jgi:hypothetical protein
MIKAEFILHSNKGDFMKKIKIVTAAMIFLLLLSCSKKETTTYRENTVNGIKITESSAIPADSTFKVELKEVCFINNENLTDPEQSFRQPSSMDFDDQGNFFVLDRTKYKIFKYDTAGKLVKIFGGQGRKPNEFVNPGTINVRKDTLFVTDFDGSKILKFDLNGEFIANKQYQDMEHFPLSPYKFGENYITYGSMKSKKYDDGRGFTSIESSLYDKNFNFVKNLRQLEYENPADSIESDPSEKGLKAASSQIEAYMYENSKTEYKIDVYDLKGDKIREIKKKYDSIETTEEQKKMIIEFNEKNGKKYRQDYLNSIYNIFADKYNRLWVISSTQKKEEALYYDIFDKDIFVNRIKLDKEQGYAVHFVADKIVCVNYKNSNVKIYEY